MRSFQHRGARGVQKSVSIKSCKPPQYCLEILIGRRAFTWLRRIQDLDRGGKQIGGGRVAIPRPQVRWLHPMMRLGMHNTDVQCSLVDNIYKSTEEPR